MPTHGWKISTSLFQDLHQAVWYHPDNYLKSLVPEGQLTAWQVLNAFSFLISNSLFRQRIEPWNQIPCTGTGQMIAILNGPSLLHWFVLQGLSPNPHEIIKASTKARGFACAQFSAVQGYYSWCYIHLPRRVDFQTEISCVCRSLHHVIKQMMFTQPHGEDFSLE